MPDTDTPTTPDAPPLPTPTNLDPNPPDSLEARLQAAEATAREATLRYREARLAATPELPAELVTGDSIAEIDASIERAGRIVEAIRARLAPAAASPAPTTPTPPLSIPPGAPTRSASSASPNAWANLTATEKIRAALAR